MCEMMGHCGMKGPACEWGLARGGTWGSKAGDLAP
jgi:hypothetical protein